MIKKLRSLTSREKAFTLIELLIVIAIIGILTVAFLPGALKAPAKARDAQRQKAVRDIQAVVESYIVEHSGTIPPDNGGKFCFISTLIPGGSFNPLPVDPKPPATQAKASCDDATQNAAENANGANKYFYRAVTTPLAGQQPFYIVAAAMEVRGSGNSSAVYSGVGVSISTITARKLAGANNDIEDTLNAAPNIDRPYFILIGPANF